MEIHADDLIIRGIENEMDAVFTTDNYGAFNASACMRYALEHGRKVIAQQYAPHVLKCMLNCDLDIEHSFRLMQLGDRELWARTLLLYVELNDGTQMCIDGNHRLAECARRSMQRGESLFEVKSLIISLADAQRFRVTYHRLDRFGREIEISGAEMLDEIRGVYSDRDGSIRDSRDARYGT